MMQLPMQFIEATFKRRCTFCKNDGLVDLDKLVGFNLDGIDYMNSGITFNQFTISGKV